MFGHDWSDKPIHLHRGLNAGSQQVGPLLRSSSLTFTLLGGQGVTLHHNDQVTRPLEILEPIGPQLKHCVISVLLHPEPLQARLPLRSGANGC